MIRTIVRRRTTVAVAGIALAALASACGASDSGSSSGGTGDGKTVKVDTAALQARLDTYRKIPEFIPPGPSFDAKTLRGKTVFNIPVASNVPFVEDIDRQMKAVADKVGINFINCPNQGSPAEWVQCMNQAVSRKVDVIILDAGPNPAQLQPQIAAAHKAGIPVISTNNPQPLQCNEDENFRSQRFPDMPICQPKGSVPDDVIANIDGLVPAPFAPAAILMADAIVHESKGKAHILIVESPDLYDSKAIVKMIQDEVREQCGDGCPTTVVGVPVPKWSTKIQGEVQTALTKDPSIDYVLPIFDSMSEYVKAGILGAGRMGKTVIGATFNGTPSVLSMIANDGILHMDAGQSLAWTGSASMDQAMRLMAGLPAVPDELIPLRIFDKSNVAEAGNPPDASKGYGDSFVSGYEKLWQISGS